MPIARRKSPPIWVALSLSSASWVCGCDQLREKLKSFAVPPTEVVNACPLSPAAATLLGGRREVGYQVVTRDQQAEQDSDDQVPKRRLPTSS